MRTWAVTLQRVLFLKKYDFFIRVEIWKEFGSGIVPLLKAKKTRVLKPSSVYQVQFMNHALLCLCQKPFVQPQKKKTKETTVYVG